jgi:dolichyl-phosphate beta-glucosyltransferase
MIFVQLSHVQSCCWGERFLERVGTRPLLSIIIPAYNEEKRLPDSLEKIAAFVKAQPFETEVLVVDDGSRDATAAWVDGFHEQHPFVAVIRNEHRGKGCAVKSGMLAGRGDYLFLCDADLSMPIEQVLRFLPPQRQDYDVAIGSREVAGARRYGEPRYRHLMGRVFNLVVRLFAVPGFQDTQCGFKAFRREVAQNVFALQTMDGFGFDVEVLFIAQRKGYKIVEVPIDWYHVANSRISPVRDTFKMFRDVLEVRWNHWKGLYR